MLLHNFYYGVKGILRERTSVFWTAVFPFILGTLFYVSFGNAIDNAERFHEIPIGFVEVDDIETTEAEATKEDAGSTTTANIEEAAYFLEILESLVDEEGTKMFKIMKLTEKEAKEQLEDGKLDGYYLVEDEISLVIAENGTNQTILNIFLEKYQQRSAMIKEVLKTNPAKLEAMIETMEADVHYYKEVNQTEGNMDPMSQYFYALIAMSCLFGSNLSFERAKRMQANVSVLGARRGVAPVKKSTVIMSEFIACLLIQCMIGVALIGYLKGICGIDLGDKLGYMLLTVFTGSAFGIALGFSIGSIGNISEGAKNGINLSITLGLSFLSGLMIHPMKQFIEDHVPIVNRINPATLITDGLYALNVYETMERYWTNMITLMILTVALCVTSILMVRRTRYASI